MSRPRKQGVVLIEMIIYVSVLAMIAALVVQSLLVMTRSYLDFRVSRTLVQTAEGALERMVREIRLADDITDVDSTFGSHPGRLTLSTTDLAGNPITVEFYMASSTLYIKEGTGSGVTLLPPSVEVTNLVFQKITTSTSKGVKIEVTLRDSRGNPPRSMKFYSTVGLRGSY